MKNTSHQTDDMEKLTAAARRTDPLFGHLLRDFEPTIQQVVEYIDIEGIPYQFPRSNRDRMTLTFDPDRLAAISDVATKHDMSVSATVDLLLRVALGDYAEWWNHHGSSFEKANEGDKS